MFSDLKSSKLIHLKGWLFLLLGISAATILLLECFNYQVAALLAICVWSFCRFYYYAFYVVEKYIDSGYKFAGLLSFAFYLLKKKRNRI
jgi:hypothetical protein